MNIAVLQQQQIQRPATTTQGQREQPLAVQSQQRYESKFKLRGQQPIDSNSREQAVEVRNQQVSSKQNGTGRPQSNFHNQSQRTNAMQAFSHFSNELNRHKRQMVHSQASVASGGTQLQDSKNIRQVLPSQTQQQKAAPSGIQSLGSYVKRTVPTEDNLAKAGGFYKQNQTSNTTKNENRQASAASKYGNTSKQISQNAKTKSMVQAPVFGSAMSLRDLLQPNLPSQGSNANGSKSKDLKGHHNPSQSYAVNQSNDYSNNLHNRSSRADQMNKGSAMGEARPLSSSNEDKSHKVDFSKTANHVKNNGNESALFYARDKGGSHTGTSYNKKRSTTSNQYNFDTEAQFVISNQRQKVVNLNESQAKQTLASQSNNNATHLASQGNNFYSTQTDEIINQNKTASRCASTGQGPRPGRRRGQFSNGNQTNKTIVNHIQTIVRNKTLDGINTMAINKASQQVAAESGSQPADSLSQQQKTNINFFTSGNPNQNSKPSSSSQRSNAMQNFYLKFNNNKAFQNQHHHNQYTNSNTANSSNRLQTAQTNAVAQQNNPGKAENSFTRKLKENRQNFKQQQQALHQQNNFFNGRMGQRSQSSYNQSGLRNNEFSTPNCSNLNDYHFGKQIGHGAYAVVKECIHKPSGERVAIKQYDRVKLMDIQRKKQAIREIRILSRLSHHNIVRLFEAIDTPKYVYLVMEYVQGESLHAHLKAQQNRRFSEDKAKHIIKQLIGILSYLHSRNVTHRDIKLENIIIDKRGIIKLIDFGFCCCTSNDVKLKIFCGTPSYMCPEIVMKKDYSGPPTDIWATGILLFAMLCGQFPFRGMTDKELYKKIARGYFQFPEHLSGESKHFLNKMLVVCPSGRSTASQLLQDPWLQSTRKELNQNSEMFLSTNESSGFHQQINNL